MPSFARLCPIAFVVLSVGCGSAHVQAQGQVSTSVNEGDDRKYETPEPAAPPTEPNPRRHRRRPLLPQSTPIFWGCRTISRWRPECRVPLRASASWSQSVLPTIPNSSGKAGCPKSTPTRSLLRLRPTEWRARFPDMRRSGRRSRGSKPMATTSFSTLKTCAKVVRSCAARSSHAPLQGARSSSLAKRARPTVHPRRARVAARFR